VVHGRDDQTIPLVEGERLARGSSSASLEVLDETGHTFGVVHPFEGTTPGLDRAIELSIRHFGVHLGTA
jgi:pimeloyl-ACP methyl ester carboxylesterase